MQHFEESTPQEERLAVCLLVLLRAAYLGKLETRKCDVCTMSGMP